jgi:hypothetical protein
MIKQTGEFAPEILMLSLELLQQLLQALVYEAAHGTLLSVELLLHPQQQGLAL